MKSILLTMEHVHIKDSASQHGLVKDLNLVIEKGEMVGLIGQSGSGKSLTSRSIMGLLAPNLEVSGTIRFQEKDLLTLSAKEHQGLLGHEIAMIFQDYRGSFTPFIKIGKQMIETIRTHRQVSKKVAKEISLQVLKEMGLDSERVFRSYSFQLSGGQVQRAAIAMALALKPSLLICDEVTTALDAKNGEKVLDYVDYLRKTTGCAVLMITHDLEEAYTRADRLYVMSDGEIVKEEFVSQGDRPRGYGLSGVRVSGQDLNQWDRSGGYGLSEAQAFVGQGDRPRDSYLTGIEKRDERSVPPSHLVIRNLTKSYSRNVHALDRFSLEIKDGECVGLVGESGSGKSTVAKILLGLEHYSEGTILFNGKPAVPKDPALLREYRKQVQMIFQDANSTLNPKLPIWKSLLEPLDNFKEVNPSFLKRESQTKKEMAETLLEMVGLDKRYVDSYPGELSGGQKQRVSIARALSLEPALLVCDEPTASLDMTTQIQILDLLKDVQRKTKMMILFISHDKWAVDYLCDRVVMMPGEESWGEGSDPLTQLEWSEISEKEHSF
ncbi:ABC transporter ATP-binding protein [Bacillus weihaiensis]|uniref:ABC transporter domain-containing protein n=1 Tax=Bacillus weihaiensis TaxID=1547283 RepID=A0A1L3MMG6_9BACI|nr:ABC transporter ATP-binding protein [Bacillus weihaiensis]APH03527.1 hypothetical protein A9C19_01470 [Bacillus weihaiensis]